MLGTFQDILVDNMAYIANMMNWRWFLSDLFPFLIVDYMGYVVKKVS